MTLTELRYEAPLAQPHFFGRVAAGYLLRQAARSIACLGVKKLIPPLNESLCQTTYDSNLSRITLN